jgi:methyl-accepting chemotaxis protein
VRSFKVLLIGMLATALAVAATLTVTALTTKNSLSEQAGHVYVDKDVTADILPPPMYLIEMRLVASQALEGSTDLATARSEIGRLKSEYLARVVYWTAAPPYGLEAQLLGEPHAAARQALMSAHGLYQRHRKGVDATVAASMTFATDEMATFDAARTGAQTTGLVALGVGAVVLLAFFLLVRRGLNQTIGAESEALATSAAALAAGDLTIRLESPHENSVAASLESMRQCLAQIIEDTRRSSEEVLVQSREIELGTQNLGQRTEQQAGSLEETASAMEELNSTVKKNAEAARKASDLATGAATVAEQGGSDVQRVAEIIAVIDEIAFQTNLLALNAAVEAARAGNVNVNVNVNDSMMEVDKMTQQNAALVEQSTAAAMGLRSPAAKLVEGVALFKLGEGGGSAARAYEPARRARPAAAKDTRGDAARAAA